MILYFKSVFQWFGNAQFLMILFMLRTVYPLKCSHRKSFFLMAGVTCGFALLNGGFSMYSTIYPEYSMFAFVAFILLALTFNWIYGHMALNIDWRQLMGGLLFFISFLELVLLISKTVGELLAFPTLMGEIMAFPLLAFLTLWLRMITRPIKIPLSNAYWSIVALTPLLMNLLITLWAGQQQGDYFLLTGVVLFAMDLMVYYFFGRMVQEMQEQMELALTNQTISFQLRQMDNIQVMLDNTRTMRHELKNHYFLLETLIQEGKDKEALEHIHKTIEPAFQKAEMVSTGNHFVDMVLSQKVSEARNLNIPVALNVFLPPKLEIDQHLLCSLLFNLWDNAIEASKKSGAPDIRFSMSIKKSYLSLMIENHIDESVLKNNPQLRTSKKDSINHGIGMSLIRGIVESTNGDLKIYEEDDYFVVSTLLQMDDPAQER